MTLHARVLKETPTDEKLIEMFVKLFGLRSLRSYSVRSYKPNLKSVNKVNIL